MIFKNDEQVRVQRQRLALLDGDSLYLRGRAGSQLHVYAEARPEDGPGLLWVTEEGYADDVFLAPGECHVLRGRGLVVATAWGSLQVRVAAPGEAAEALARVGEARARQGSLPRGTPPGGVKPRPGLRQPLGAAG